MHSFTLNPIPEIVFGPEAVNSVPGPGCPGAPVSDHNAAAPIFKRLAPRCPRKSDGGNREHLDARTFGLAPAYAAEDRLGSGVGPELRL
jgi:hypothetical protein